MTQINDLRQYQNILFIGSHPAIIQSILDFDFLSGKENPSVVAIVAAGRRYERYFFGKKEIFIPVFHSVHTIAPDLKESITFFVNVSSARRVFDSTIDVFDTIPHIVGGALFAEDVPEKHSIELHSITKKNNKFLIGPSSVGLLIPQILKLGAIGGVDARQFEKSRLFTPGNIAVFSASGGMTNELIRIVAQNGRAVSFALSFGGDRFPIFTPEQAFLTAEHDTNTDAIIYFGELGGNDEYRIVKLLEDKKITKKVICYVAGTISELFEEPPQFGHAKAMARTKSEGAREKREALKKVGVIVPESFTEFVQAVRDLPTREYPEYTVDMSGISDRKHAMIASSVSYDKDNVPFILGENLLDFSKNYSFGCIVASMFLGKKIKSKELEGFVDFILRLLVDHGPYVSGAVNTIVASRAGKDLPSALSAGLLTVGPRFGGAINQAAENWLIGVHSGKSADEFVEGFASNKKYIAGIGHRKYRVDLPDPRVTELLVFSEKLEKKSYTSFALSVEKVTAAKKGNLILNVDGAIAAVLLDILSEKEEYTSDQLQQLIDIEFFNSFFVLSRSVGFISHFLDQKRLDEGLFRLEEDQVAVVESTY